jgi:hypothetical protein
MRNKKGQEEVVGFVFVVLLVAVIFLVLLGISIRSNSVTDNVESVEVSQFLASLMEHTTECAIDYEPAFASVRELIGECHRNALCTSRETACDVLDETLSNVIESSWLIDPEAPIKGYIFESHFEREGIIEEIVELTGGECGERVRGSEVLKHGGFQTTMEICL